MKIGFDLDKVFVEHPPLVPDALIERLYKKKANGELLYRIPSYPEQIIRKASHYPLFRQPMKNNLNYIFELAKKKHKLYLLSGRFGFLRKHTDDFIHKYNLQDYFEGMYFNYENEQPHIFKDKVLKTLHLDIYVDDDQHLLNFVAKRHEKTMFFLLKPHSPQIRILPNLTSVATLHDIVE